MIANGLQVLGGIGLTRVHVYHQRPAPDGLQSGCPHVHAICDEAYFILAGRGHAEFHDLEHGYREIPLETGDYLAFPANTLHRIVNGGDLVILGIMSNAGLAERGEARIYFGPEVDADPARFEELRGLPKTRGLEGALDRRDAAVGAYLGLQQLRESSGEAYRAELRRFFTLHAEETRRAQGTYREAIETGPVAWGAESLRRLEALPSLAALEAPLAADREGAPRLFGMCGLLKPVSPAAVG
jgi:mannose-6-phosphate isomerase-like protein (cupin superfamily)